MAYATYRFTMKSEEQVGASQSNTVYIDLDDGGGDADAALFAANLELLFAADVVSVDKQIASNFTRSMGAYPAGTNNQWRYVVRPVEGSGGPPAAPLYSAVQTERVYNVLAAASAEAFAAAYKGATGIGWVDRQANATQPALITIDSVDPYVMAPGDSR